jgi:Fur family transcriptional regulator, stress-responsive regulator
MSDTPGLPAATADGPGAAAAEGFDAHEAARQLRAAGLRVTRPRLAVLRALTASPHSDVDTLVTAVRRELGSVSVQAVYDVLRALAAGALVRRIEPAGSPSRYELRVGDNHHHIVCRSCGATADVDCAVGAAPCLEPSQAHGYQVDEAEVTYWGVCPSCTPAREQA